MSRPKAYHFQTTYLPICTFCRALLCSLQARDNVASVIQRPARLPRLYIISSSLHSSEKTLYPPLPPLHNAPVSRFSSFLPATNFQQHLCYYHMHANSTPILPLRVCMCDKTLSPFFQRSTLLPLPSPPKPLFHHTCPLHSIFPPLSHLFYGKPLFILDVVFFRIFWCFSRIYFHSAEPRLNTTFFHLFPLILGVRLGWASSCCRGLVVHMEMMGFCCNEGRKNAHPRM